MVAGGPPAGGFVAPQQSGVPQVASAGQTSNPQSGFTPAYIPGQGWIQLAVGAPPPLVAAQPPAPQTSDSPPRGRHYYKNQRRKEQFRQLRDQDRDRLDEAREAVQRPRHNPRNQPQ